MLPGIAISLIALSIPALYAKADSINTSKQQIPSETANFLAHKSGEKETVVQDTTKVTVWNKKAKGYRGIIGRCEKGNFHCGRNSNELR